jgi:hypothetical protein
MSWIARMENSPIMTLLESFLVTRMGYGEKIIRGVAELLSAMLFPPWGTTYWRLFG